MMKWVFAAATLVATAASADLTYGESPRNFMLEVKAGPYTPLIDRSFTSMTGPYYTTFASAPMIMGELELDFEIWQKFGSVSVGLSGGYAEKFGRSRDAETKQPTGSSTGLRVFPIKLLGIYRFDYFALRKNVPLVPYLKVGLVAIPFSVVNSGAIEVSKGSRGAGVRFGAVGVLGLSLLLDVLDQRLSRDFDNSMGVNHSYLFAEFALQEANNFLPAGGFDLDLSSRHFMFGLGFEF